jgi:hypothetical protein
MQIWISDVKVIDYTDTKVRTEIDASGPLAIQVHGGGRWIEGGAVQFRNIRVRDLTQDCTPTVPGAGGSSGQAGSAGAASMGGVSPSSGGAAAGNSSSGTAPASVGGGGSASGSGGPSGGTAPSTPAATPKQSVERDSGCNLAARHTPSGAGLLLLFGFGLRRRRRRQPWP